MRVRQVGGFFQCGACYTEMGRINEWPRETVLPAAQTVLELCCFHLSLLQDLRTLLTPATAGLLFSFSLIREGRLHRLTFTLGFYDF